METRQEAQRLRAVMCADHERLERMFRGVVAIMHIGHRDEVRAAWLALEAGLIHHLDVEERYILPAFSERFPQEAAHICAEHDEIRKSLVQLGIALDLHELREEAASQFITKLRKHAAREDMFFYVWAEAHLPEEAKRTFVHRFREWFARDTAPRSMDVHGVR